MFPLFIDLYTKCCGSMHLILETVTKNTMDAIRVVKRMFKENKKRIETYEENQKEDSLNV